MSVRVYQHGLTFFDLFSVIVNLIRYRLLNMKYIQQEMTVDDSFGLNQSETTYEEGCFMDNDINVDFNSYYILG